MAKPEIRLKGFEGERKEVLLSKIATMHARIGWQNLRKDEFLSKGEYYLITGTDFDDGRVDYKTCHFVEKVRYDQDKNIQVKNGSILITKDGTLGKVAFVENLNKPATLNAGVFNVMCKNNDVDSRFLFQYLRSPLLMDYVNLTATGGTIKHLNQNILVNFPVQLPLIEEQVFLGTYFQHLDNIVHNTIKEIASLKQMKSASLISMFPQAGETTPRVRFKGFEGEWEKKSFGDLYEHNIVKNDLSFGVDKVISVANMYYNPNTYISDQNYLRTYNVFKLGDIAFEGNKSKNFAHGRFVENTIGDGIVSHVFEVFSPKSSEYDLYFWKYAINNERLMGQILVRCTKASTMMTNLVARDFLKESFLVPSYEEQRKIGSYFSSLDKQISLQEQRLEKLKQIKAACLDKMFV